MQHAAHKEKVTAEFDRLHSGAPVKERLNLRGQVARDLFKKEPSSVQKDMEKEADAAHEVQLAKYSDAMEGAPSLDPEAQAEYVLASLAYLSFG